MLLKVYFKSRRQSVTDQNRPRALKLRELAMLGKPILGIAPIVPPPVAFTGDK